jgi:hypothetical protein
MPALAQRRSPVEIDERLDDLASGDTEIMPLELGALDARRPRPRDAPNRF